MTFDFMIWITAMEGGIAPRGVVLEHLKKLDRLARAAQKIKTNSCMRMQITKTTPLKTLEANEMALDYFEALDEVFGDDT